MAISDSKGMRGLIGKLVVKTLKNGQVIYQTAPDHVPQTENSKKTASIMGNASTFSKAIRDGMAGLFGDNYPGNMVNDLNTLNREILEHCCDKATQTYTFQPDSFANLSGFEFNDRSPLSTSFWVKPKVDINESGDKITLTIPAFEVPQQIKMPKGANTFQFVIMMGQIALHCSAKKFVPLQRFELEEDQVQVPAQTFTFDIMPGCLGVIGIGIKYFSAQGKIMTPLNTKELNPAAIVGAIYNPGEFIEPMPVAINGKSKATGWFPMMKLKLNAANPEG